MNLLCRSFLEQLGKRSDLEPFENAKSEAPSLDSMALDSMLALRSMSDLRNYRALIGRSKATAGFPVP
jgi:hypothetical protein